MLFPILLASLPSLAAPGYLRQPDIWNDELVFTAEGDLWRARVDGSQARRITTAPGDESYAHFSPDGRFIAFSASYDGNTDIFLMPAGGGEPRRLTWHPDADEALGWWPDGSRVIFRSKRENPTGRSYELFTVDTVHGEIRKLPLGWAAMLDVEPETGMYAFNRISRELRTWKRYRGGTRQDLWVGDPARQDYHRVGDFDGPDAFPMWWKGAIWFLSDEGGTANLWSMQPDGTGRQRHTRERAWDIRFPAMGPDGRIVYMRAGDLWVFDPRDESARQVPLDLPTEQVLTRKRYTDAAEWMAGWSIAPDGDRVLLVSRGEVFSVPTGTHGVTLPVTATSGARESWASFSPDGERVVYVTDEPGEEAVVTADAWGRGDMQTIQPAGTSGWHFAPVYSPDGKWIAWGDDTQTLRIAPVQGGEIRTVDHDEQLEITDYSWSPDGRWLAYVRHERTGFGSVYVHDTRSGVGTRITGSTTDDFSPAWDPQGRYLYFLSARTVNPVLGMRDFDYVQTQAVKPYVVLLRPDVPNPFAPDAGLPPTKAEEKKARKEAKKDDDDDDEAEEAPVEVEIAMDGIEDRVVAVPVPAGVYHDLGATKDRIFWLSSPVEGMNREPSPDPKNELVSWKLEDRKQETFVTGITGYRLALEGKKLGFDKKPGEIFVVGTDTPPGDDLKDATVSLSHVVIEVDPRAEWRQIFNEGWRLMRDFYWEPHMAGLDWQAERDRYASLLPRIANRDDLKDLMGELIGELATSHTYVWGGDRPELPSPLSTGLLGADLSREGDAWKVLRIYRGDPADNVRSPLSEPGVDVREGEYIQAVNHRPVPVGLPFEAALEARAGVPVVLTVSDRATGGRTRDVAVTPSSEEHSLRYADWVRRNREYVEQASNGRLGYLHIPDMGARGLTTFETWFYPQLGREGLVVDVRWNGGGFVSQLILERLRRKVVGYDVSRGGGLWTWPEKTLQGPFVVITNEFAGSDGDIFPTAVQVEGLAPVVGQRSWGGVVGIRGDKPLVDKGMITQPEYAFWFPRKGWGVENHGVDPDIPVQNLPQDLAAGRDPQLDRAIQECIRLRDGKTWVKPDFEPPSIKTREEFRKREE